MNSKRIVTIIVLTALVARVHQFLAIPTSFFIDRGGVIRVVRVGKMNEEMMKGFIAEASK